MRPNEEEEPLEILYSQQTNPNRTMVKAADMLATSLPPEAEPFLVGDEAVAEAVEVVVADAEPEPDWALACVCPRVGRATLPLTSHTFEIEAGHAGGVLVGE